MEINGAPFLCLDPGDPGGEPLQLVHKVLVPVGIAPLRPLCASPEVLGNKECVPDQLDHFAVEQVCGDFGIVTPLDAVKQVLFLLDAPIALVGSFVRDPARSAHEKLCRVAPV